MRLLVFLSATLLASTTLLAQTPRAKGFVYNANAYQSAVKKRDLDTRGAGLRELPIRLSLRPFCPTPQDQGLEPSCTAWAIAYGAVTIQQAVQRRIYNNSDVNKIASSKSFVYNQLPGVADGDVPSIESSFDFLRAHGTCLATTFRNDLPVSEQPDELALYEAQSRRLLTVTEVYDADSTIKINRQIQRFKRILADSTPIVVGMRLPYSFSNLTEKVFDCDPEEPLDSSAHALCVIGYDDIDSTFECMNSWGTAWGGDQGFVRLHYRDVFRWMCCAYRLKPQFLLEKKSTSPRAAVVLRRSVGYNEQREPRFEEIRVCYDSLQQQYHTVQPSWPAGAGFQLTLREVPEGWWVYVFNINQKGVVSMYHRDKIPGGTVEKVIPGEERKFETEDEGSEWLGILFSKSPVPDFESGLQKAIQAASGAIVAPTQQYFNTILPQKINYTPYRMGFSFPKNAAGNAGLLFLKIVTGD